MEFLALMHSVSLNGLVNFIFFLLFLCSMFAYVWAHMCIGMYALELEVDVWTYMYIGMYALELAIDVWAHMCIGMHAWELAVDVKNQF